MTKIKIGFPFELARDAKAAVEEVLKSVPSA